MQRGIAAVDIISGKLTDAPLCKGSLSFILIAADRERNEWMKDLHIDKKIADMRRERGITQEELAERIGVTKASVSKWENAQSFPDIALLPVLASYFNISIDELMGYAPQMTEEEIRRLFTRLSEAFSREQAGAVLAECRDVLRRYYSCFPVLLQMVLFYINHCSVLPEEEKRELLREAIRLCGRIRTECDDLFIRRQAVGLEAACQLLLDRPEQTLELLGKDAEVLSEDESLIALAYQSLGDDAKAKQVIQVSIYQHMSAAASHLVSYLYLNADRPELLKESWRRLEGMMEVFHLEQSNPAIALRAYMIAAGAYSRLGEKHKSLDLLNRFAEVSCRLRDKRLIREDSFFDEVEAWMAGRKMDSTSMQCRRAIQNDFLAGMTDGPEFDAVRDEPGFLAVIRRLKDREEQRQE